MREISGPVAFDTPPTAPTPTEPGELATKAYVDGASTGASGTVTSVNDVSPDDSGNVELTAADVGADSSGAAATAQANAEAFATTAAATAQSNAEAASMPATNGTATSPTLNNVIIGGNAAQVFTPIEMNSEKVTGLANGASPTDAATVGQLPAGGGNASQNDVFAGPATGGAGAPSFRALVAADLSSVADFAPSGLTGAVNPTRYVGGTVSGSPVSGTFAAGDFVVSQNGTIWTCVTAGTPGSWNKIPVLNFSASNTQPTGTANTAGSTGISADAGHVHVQNYATLFGDGSDGAAVLNGTNTFSWATLSGSVYTLTRNVYLSSLTISSGITLLPCAVNSQPFLIFVAGTLTFTGTISASGANATSATGAASGGTYVSGAGGGGSGTTTAGGGPGGATANRVGGGGASGNGGTGASGSGAVGQSSSAVYGSWIWRSPYAGALASSFYLGQSARAPYNSGGGSGGGDGTNSGGGGGGGGGFVLIFAEAVVNNGTISAAGGNGYTPVTGNCGGGGGGAGGVIVLWTLSAVTGSGSAVVSGGALGSGVGSGTAGTAGTSGSYLNVIIM